MVKKSLLLGLLAGAVALGMAVGIRARSADSQVLDLLRRETRQRWGEPISESWQRLGPTVNPVLLRTLERNESAPARYLRTRLNGLAERWDRPEWIRPSPSELRSAAARVLAAQGPIPPETISSLIRAVELGSARDEATLVLLTVGPAASNAVPVLLQQVRESKPRQIPARALLRIGAPPEVWLELQSDDRGFARMAGTVGEMLSECRTNAALEYLADAAGRPDTYQWAGRVLRDLGPAAAPVAGKLARGLKLPSPVARAFTAELLGDLAPDSQAAVPALVQALAEESDRDVRLRLVIALGQLGPAASPALPQLQLLRQGADEEMIRHAREAVERIQP